MSTRETSLAYTRPYRPLAVRLANALGRWLAPIGLRATLTAGALKATAMRRNRLEDFGDPPVDEPLERLVSAIETEAALHPVGRWITRERLVGVLGNRLRARELRRRHPEIGAVPVAPPLVIVGLQRTGTTLLHRLLGADAGTRALRSWEALNPAPFLRHRRDPRRRLAKTGERTLAYLAPDFFAVHPVEADGLEEDSILLDFSLLSPVAEATLRVSSYADWLASVDLTPAYRTAEAMLQLLQWQRPAARWVLKSPAHLPYLDLLLRVFPDARLVHTHRDPAETVASYCSMIAHGRGVFSDDIDPVALGRELLAKQSDMLLTGMRLRRDPTVGRAIIDVDYADLVADPIATVARIYEHAGWDLADPAPLRAVLATQQQHRFGRHRYDLDAFGLTRDQVRRAFAPYLDERPLRQAGA